jgi:hypothetical protein
MKYEIELMDKIRSCDNIIVYGAAVRGQCVIRRITAYGLHGKLYIVVTKLDSKEQTLYGMPVREISLMSGLCGSTCVLVAAQPSYHAEMERTSRNLSFDTITIDDELFNDMRLRDEADRHYRKSQFLQYQTMNLVRVGMLSEKVRRGKKVKVVFVLTEKTKFHCASVYHSMAGKSLFEPMLFVMDEYFCGETFYRYRPNDVMYNYYLKLKEDGFNVIWGYDEFNNPKNIQECYPDIVFFNAPFWFNRVGQPIPPRTTAKYLTCYLSYGMHVSNEPEYHFENDNITHCWLHFIDTRQAFDYCALYAFTNGANTVLSGHPMLDRYIEPGKPFVGLKLPKNPVVVYAPHWSIETWHNTATFQIYAAKIMELLIANPSVNFVFKPHARLAPEIHIRENKSDRASVTYAYYQEYCDNWRNSPNGIIVEDSSFIDLFKNADCLITDCYTFLTAWLPTDKPCIFLMNPEGPQDPYKYYYGFIKPVIDSYYTVYTNDELSDVFYNLFVAGNDEKSEQRKAVKEQLIYNLGHAGEFIANYIERQITDGDSL